MKKYTPMIRQYLEIKESQKDALVFYRLGDFYELFFDDAKIAAKELDLVLTARSGGSEKIAMCGVPHHAATSYIVRLAQKGYKIAIVEQLEDPKDAKGIVKRGVVRVITPGTVMELLNEDSDSIYLASVISFSHGYALVFTEMISGNIIASLVEKNESDLLEKILTYNVKEIVIKENDLKLKNVLKQLVNISISESEIKTLAEYYDLYKHIDNTNMIESIQLTLTYLDKNQKKLLKHFKKVEMENQDNYLKIDYTSIVNLELINSNNINNKQMSLYKFINKTKTSMGSRLLKDWIIKPLVNKDLILDRQSKITIFKDNFILRDNLQTYLNDIYDLERLIAKFGYGNANPLDAKRLKQSLEQIPTLFNLLTSYPQFSYLSTVDKLEDLYSTLDKALLEDLPSSIREGNIFKYGYDKKLDQAKNVKEAGQDWIIKLEAKERKKTGINNLKVGYNRIFGYYIEVSKANMYKLKEEDGYTRKQTLTNSERLVTNELKEKEAEILNADEISNELEYQLFLQLVEMISSKTKEILKLSEIIANIDVLYSLSILADSPTYSLPKINEENKFEIINGKHPILAEMLKSDFITNDINMNDSDIWIITGPNMGGKSTFMRQSVLIVIMALMGSYIPADSANIPIFDQIFTRIGASDDILSGHSTFMVEMFEANKALSKATKNSLIIFDEIGRGTSTYDGMALAKAMIEYLSVNIQAKTLFSTHYHQLITLEKDFSNVKNYHVEVSEEAGEIIFLYKVVKGFANRSYGINVAKLAGISETVTSRAFTILNQLESKVVENNNEVVFKEKEVIPLHIEKTLKLITDINVDNMTPMEALQLLADLKAKLK